MASLKFQFFLLSIFQMTNLQIFSHGIWLSVAKKKMLFDCHYCSKIFDNFFFLRFYWYAKYSVIASAFFLCLCPSMRWHADAAFILLLIECDTDCVFSLLQASSHKAIQCDNHFIFAIQRKNSHKVWAHEDDRQEEEDEIAHIRSSIAPLSSVSRHSFRHVYFYFVLTFTVFKRSKYQHRTQQQQISLFIVCVGKKVDKYYERFHRIKSNPHEIVRFELWLIQTIKIVDPWAFLCKKRAAHTFHYVLA